MIFSEIQYDRVDLEARKQKAEALLARLRGASSFEELEQVIIEDKELEGQGLMSMRTVAQIRRDIDTRDAFYDEEIKFYTRELPKYRYLGQAWTQALLESPFRRQLEEKYGVELPICDAVWNVLYDGKDPKEEIQALFRRTLKPEWDF